MKIEFVIPTYNRSKLLMATISSLYAQTNDNWTAHIVTDNYWDDYLEKIKNFYADSDKIRFTITDKRYNDWGHTPRNIGLKQCKEEWVIMTGDDNYYVPVFVDEFLKVVKTETNVVFCNMVHNWNNLQYYPVKCIPRTNNIDIGCFMVRSKLGSQMEINLEHKELADGMFLEEYIKRFAGSVEHIDKILYTHN